MVGEEAGVKDESVVELRVRLVLRSPERLSNEVLEAVAKEASLLSPNRVERTVSGLSRYPVAVTVAAVDAAVMP